MRLLSGAHVEDVLIPQHILHMDGQMVAKASDDRSFITAVFFRQMEQVHQVAGRPLLIGYGYILYGTPVPPNASMIIWEPTYPPAKFQWVSVL